MEALTYIDTHVAAWLFAGRTDLFSRRSLKALEDADLLISPFVLMELHYLHETRRLSVTGETVVRALQAQIGLRTCDLPFSTVVTAALGQKWTRDPFDRIIVAQAAAANRPLISKDRTIRRHYRQTVW